MQSMVTNQQATGNIKEAPGKVHAFQECAVLSYTPYGTWTLEFILYHLF
jgi:hypothetical protein